MLPSTWTRIAGRTAAGLALGCVALAAPAQDEPRHEVGVLVGAGFGDDTLVGSDKDWTPNPLIGLRYGIRLGESFVWFVDGTVVAFNGETPLGDVDVASGRTGLEYLLPGESGRWFLAGSGGWMKVNPKGSATFDRALVSLGVGRRFVVGDHSSARLELRGERTLDDDGLNGQDITNGQLLFGMSFGPGGTPADSDADGVSDRRDRCPDTPRGATVDERGCPTDSDGDGVYDGIDRCPDTPRGVPVDAQGCPKDSDGDGVPDGIDRCPDTPRGATVDAQGCPKDSDGDGVPDGIDRCPDTPRGSQVDAVGCPPPAPPPPTPAPETRAAPIFEEGRRNLILEGVNFETAKATLLPESRGVLDRVAASLRDWPEIRVEVGGHTDARGNDAYNQRLSEARAQTVRDYLVDHGVDALRLTTRGYGESRPIADNTTAEGLARNRRVELTRMD